MASCPTVKLTHYRTRGLWLVFLERGVQFQCGFRSGNSEYIVGDLIHLPIRVLAPFSIAVIVLHNLADSINSGSFGALNPYGDPGMTVLSFLRCAKYPPSLDFLLMTPGPALLLLAWFDRLTWKPANPLIVFGRVPLFHFMLHLYLAHLPVFCSRRRHGRYRRSLSRLSLVLTAEGAQEGLVAQLCLMEKGSGFFLNKERERS